MQLYARIVDDTVAELWPHDPAATLPEGVATPVDAFGKDFGGRFVPCGADVRQGWNYDGKTFAPPVPAAQPVPVRTAPGYLLIKAAKGTKMSGRDLAYIGGRPSVPENADSVKRISDGDGTTPKAWFDAALGVAA